MPGVRAVTYLSVLNALRHQRNWNLIDNLGESGLVAACSTPYGIKGIGTSRNLPSWQGANCRAQRLTASKELELTVGIW